MTLSVTEGTLTVTAGRRCTVATNGSKSVTITGTLAQINALLTARSTISTTPTIRAPLTLTLSINDNGNTGTGGPLTGSDTATINITPIVSTATYKTFHNGTQTNQTEIDISGANSGTARIILTFDGPVTFTGGKPLTMADGDEIRPSSDGDVANYSASLSDPAHGVLVFTYTPE